MSFGILAVIVCAGLGGPLLALGRRGLVPVVVGELAAGVVVGKTGTRWVDTGEPTTAFFSQVGFAMLMFTAGMHVPIRQPGIARGLRRGALAALVVGALSAPAGIATAAALGGGHAAIYALLLASGSAAILLPVLEEEKLLGDERVLPLMAQVGIADVAAIVSLPLVLQPSKARDAVLGLLAVAGAAAAIFALAHVVRGRGLLHRIRRASKRRSWALDLRLALLALFTLAWIATRAGTSILIAGFSVGLLVALIGGPKRLSTQVTGIGAGFFVPLFFVTLGAKLDLRAVFSHPSMLELTGLLTVANVAVHAAGALVTRQPLPAALAATAQLGLPAGVVTLGLQQHVLSAGQSGAILLAALVTIALCPAGVALIVRARAPVSPSAAMPAAEQP
ncbi:MAG TPA: cation:proton antiporter [Gaiellaceae bacterium]|jgi:Kef-type K+ transport system membrane component KefB|nr:cation:proton antiporter [Gaiellaceae bacterium]